MSDGLAPLIPGIEPAETLLLRGSPASYRYRGSYPRRNGSPQNCCSRAGDERSA